MISFAWLTRKRPEPAVERPKYLHIPFGTGQIGMGTTFNDGKPAVVIFPPNRVGVPGEAYDGPGMDDGPPEGSIILTFHNDKAAFSLINLILKSLEADFATETAEPAND